MPSLRLLLIALCLAAALPASAEPAPAPPAGTAGDLEEAERNFLVTARSTFLALVALGGAAADRAVDGTVRSFGERLVAELIEANASLGDLAARKHVALPNAPDRQAEQDLQDLNGRSGSDFDRAFVRRIAEEQQGLALLFERFSKAGGDPDLRAFADRVAPFVTQLREGASDLAGRLG